MKKERNKNSKLATEAVEELKRLYPSADCALEYEGDPWKLLVMARLSAQCTDARVNIVCRELFVRYPDMKAMAEAELSELEEAVRPCGLHKVKARDLRDMCVQLINDFGGSIPTDMDELLTLPGVGRKIANLIRGDLFGLPAIVTDTHCIRICGRLGFYPESEKNPQRIERILTAAVAPDEQADFCHRLVWFGREVCTARSPKCTGCPLGHICAHGKKLKRSTEKHK